VKKGRASSAQKEEHDHPIDPMPSELIRRRFLAVHDTGSAALAARSARVLTRYVRGEEEGSQNGESASTSGKTGGKPTSVQPIEFSDTDELILSEGFCYEIIRSSGNPLTANQVSGDHNDYVAYFPIDTLKGGEESEDGIRRVKHEYIDPMFWSDYTDPENQTKKTREQITREKAGRLARVKSILAASTRHDWEADGPRLWVRKGDRQLRIVDLTDDEGRVEIDEEWARNAGAGSVALRVELSICHGSELLAKVPVVCVDSGRAFIPWPHEDEEGRLVVALWQYDLCRVISPGEYLGAYPVRSYLKRAGIVVI
jgi:Bacterial protein of unknown function (DUF839)